VDASETVGEDSRGYDGGKSRDGRMRHVLTDTEGLLLEVTVTTADVHDSKAAPALLETFMDEPGRLLKLVWVDSAYQGPALAKAFARHGVRIEVVRRSDGQRGFVVLARRWVVERTLSWLSRSRRLNRDHERRPDHHQQMVWWAAMIRLSRRMAADAPRWPEKRPERLLQAPA
jgi:transposase